jgi:endo-1,4-beta-xylanase
VLTYGNEIGGLEVIYYGTNRSIEELPETKLSYIGREANANWRADAAARIENHRKGDFELKIVDTNNAPIAFANLDIEMTRHQAMDNRMGRHQRTLRQSRLDGCFR